MKILRFAVRALTVLIALAIVGLAAVLLSMSGSFHEPASLHRFAGFAAPEGPVLVVGATQNTGLEIVRELRARGLPVVASVRATSNTAALDALGVEKVVFDAMNADEVRAAIQPGRFAAVVSTLGTAARDLPQRRGWIQALTQGQNRMDPAKRPDYTGNRNLVDAAKEAGVRRFVLVTVIGTGDSADAAPRLARRTLADIIPLKEQAEEYLRASGLDYTIVRPGGLGPRVLAPTGEARLTEDPASFSYIGRTDLARLVVDALGDASTVGRTYTAWDPARLNVWNLFAD
jgi:uncharacterized protein YbjT (DUF2867 family)